MSSITIDNNVIEFEFNGIKIIDFHTPNLLVKKIKESKSVFLNGTNYSNFLVIDDLTKIKDLINLGKNSFLLNELIKLINESSIINKEAVEEIVNKINKLANFELLEDNDGDFKKLIDIFFTLNNNDYLDKSSFKFYLDKCMPDDKTLLIINDLSFIKLKDLTNYLNYFDVLIITNDFRKFFSNDLNEFETVLVINDDYSFFDIIDKDRLVDYLELKTSCSFDNKDLVEFINNKNSLTSLKILNLIKTVAKN